MGGLKGIQGNYSRLAVAFESFTEEGLGGGDVTRSTLGRIRRFCPVYQQRGRGTPIDRLLSGMSRPRARNRRPAAHRLASISRTLGRERMTHRRIVLGATQTPSSRASSARSR